MSHWNHTTQAILEHIERDKAWYDLPVLADALEEAGYADTAVLAILRSNNTRWFGPWLRRVLEGAAQREQVEAAVDWLESCAARFAEADYRENFENPRKNLAWLMAVCQASAEDADHQETLHFSTPDYDSAELWRHYEILTGTPVPLDRVQEHEKGYPRQPFNCAC